MPGLEFAKEAPPPVNVLANRYATPEMRGTFSDDGRVILERDFWIAMMEEQADLGLDISEESIEAYTFMRDHVDHDSIRRRELTSNHDVNARLAEFNALAGRQDAHRGMTSRDLTENIEQAQTKHALELISRSMVASLGGLCKKGSRICTFTYGRSVP